MLRTMDDLKGFAIHATDGTIGRVKDFYFDDVGWALRYFVVETGNWLMGRKVLISPISVGRVEWGSKALPVGITMEQVKNSPDIDTEKPVTRRHEDDYLGHYGYPIYWGGPGIWGEGNHPGAMMPIRDDLVVESSHNTVGLKTEAEKRAAASRHKDNIHLRSFAAVVGYHIEASDGEIGHVSGMLVDSETWAIRYLIVNTSIWWLGNQVLIAPLWVEAIQWQETSVKVNLTREAVKSAAPYSDAISVNRQDEIELHQHYDRIGYWEREENDQKFGAYD